MATTSLLDMPEDRRQRAIELAFCPTGNGGGQDNSCSSKHGIDAPPPTPGGGSTRERLIRRFMGQAEHTDWQSTKFGGPHVSKFETPTGRKFRIEVDRDDGEVTFMDNDRRMGLTGKGEAFHVFTNVTAALSDYVEQYKPKELNFYASGQSRVDLYKKLILMMKSLHPNYRAQYQDQSYSGAARTYRLRRIS